VPDADRGVHPAHHLVRDEALTGACHRLHAPRRAAVAQGRRPCPAAPWLDCGAVVDGKTLGVVVPAYNEELLVQDTLRGMPEIVDRIYVIDDTSRDATAERVREIARSDPRV